jgi:NAD(P)-dependent dehydrogenase (short-subunit alcohol dehydrogenase family)
VVDVSSVDAYVAALQDIESSHGRIDILVNNAGIDEPGMPETLEPYRRLMETNYFAAVAGTLAVLPSMRKRGAGVVVNVSSDSGRAPGPLDAAYAPSKAAMSAFTESVAFNAEADGVSLHTLYPGWVPTAMGSGAVAAGMPAPPKMVTRTEEQISKLLLSRIGGPKLDIDATLVARIAPAARAIVPGLYRRGIRRTLG